MAVKLGVFFFAVLCASVAVYFSASRPQLLISPGAPIDAHEDIAADCFACHSPFFGSSADKCTECHRPADIGIRTTDGLPIAEEKKNVSFHQQLIRADCVACHSDHRGVRPFRPINRFSHELLKPSLRQDCRGCHAAPGDALHRRIDANCGQCHEQDAWLPASFDHSEYFRFDRDHRTECTTCHVDADYGNYTCYGCHEHSRSKIREEHLEEGIRDYENCSDCHRSGDEDEAERIWKSMQRKDGGRTWKEDDSDDAETRGDD